VANDGPPFLGVAYWAFCVFALRSGLYPNRVVTRSICTWMKPPGPERFSPLAQALGIEYTICGAPATFGPFDDMWTRTMCAPFEDALVVTVAARSPDTLFPRNAACRHAPEFRAQGSPLVAARMVPTSKRKPSFAQCGRQPSRTRSSLALSLLARSPDAGVEDALRFSLTPRL